MITQTTQKCIDACEDCNKVCLDTIKHCRTMGGKHVEKSHINLLNDCAEICKSSADFMKRESNYSIDICKLCSDICDACALSCENVDPFEEKMRECANTCRDCAMTCREMTAMA